MENISKEMCCIEIAKSTAYRKVMWRILPFLFLCDLCFYLDRVNVAFAKLRILNDLGFNEAAFGFGTGVFFIGYSIFQIPGNLVMVKIGPRRWIARIMIIWGVTSASMLLVRTPIVFYLLRFLLGVAEAGFLPAIILYLTYWFPSSRRGVVTAVFLTGIPISGLIGGPLSGWLVAEFSGIGGLTGWQWLFLLEGIPAVTLGVLSLFYLNDSVDRVEWLTEEQKSIIAEDLVVDFSPHSLYTMKDGLLNGTVHLLGAAYFFIATAFFGVIFWLPSLIRSLHASSALEVGVLTAIPFYASAAAMLTVSKSSDRMEERRWHLVVAGIIGCIGLALSAVCWQSFPLAFLSLTVGTMGVMTAISQFWLLPPAILRGSAAAAGLALVSTFGSIAGLASPSVIGLVQVQNSDPGSALLGLAICLLFGSTLVLGIPAKLVNGTAAWMPR